MLAKYMTITKNDNLNKKRELMDKLADKKYNKLDNIQILYSIHVTFR